MTTSLIDDPAELIDGDSRAWTRAVRALADAGASEDEVFRRGLDAAAGAVSRTGRGGRPGEARHQ